MDKYEPKYIYNVIGHSIQTYNKNIFKINRFLSIIGGQLNNEFIMKIRKKINIIKNMLCDNVYKFSDNHIISNISEIEHKDVKELTYYIYVKR